MAEYQIITDSTTDLTAEMIKELDLQVIPLCYMMDGKTYHNIPGGGEMTEQEFYNELRTGKMPKTAQINFEEFITHFTPVLDQGKDILYLAFSSGLSGTYHSAMMAKKELEEKYPERRIEVFDTLCASMGEGLLAYYAATLKKDGKTLEEVLGWLKGNVLNLCHWFTVDDLNHLKRGGRVSAATALVGTALGIRPVMHVDNEGHLVNVTVARGRKASLDALAKKMSETAIDPGNQVVFISHGDCADDVKYLERKIKEKLGVKKFYTNYVGPVIGAHSGPGTVALFFIGKER